MNFIRFPEQCLDPGEVGGKAASLAQLAAEGFAPPPFFAITADAFRPGGAAATGLRGEIESALTQLGPGPYAVRSSGRAEDGAEHSHAGQFDTMLNVAAEDVIGAAKLVWLSGFSETVETYRAKTTGDAAEPPAIIVQNMVPADAAGIAFSADPVTGQRDVIVISATQGLGDRLVSGEVDGEDWRLALDGSVLSAPEPAAILSGDQARQIAALARQAEDSFGAPQDIEWAIADGQLHILQARPITTQLRTRPQPDNSLVIFDNSNIIESYPGVVSPLTFSFATYVYSRVYRAFVALLGLKPPVIAANSGVFDNMLSRVDGRVYYNLINWYRALALLPGFSLNRAYMETMMGVSEPMPAEVTEAIGPAPAQGLRKVTELARLLPVAWGLYRQARRLPKTKRAFYDRLNAALAGELDLSTANLTDLAAEYRRIESTLLDRWDAPLVNDFLCMMAFGASRKVLEKWLGNQGLELHNDVMIGQGDIVSAEPAQRIAKMAAMARDAGLSSPDQIADNASIVPEINAYLARFGDRCTEELKLESIPLSEDRAPLLLAIAAAAARPESPRQESQQVDWSALFPRNPIKRRIAQRLTTWAKDRVRDRENLRFERTRIFGHARRVFLAMGREFTAHGLIDTPRDVFFLTISEVLGAIEGHAVSPNLKALVALRKSEDEAASQRPDPPERIETRGPAIAPTWQETTAPQDSATSKTGTGCSAGEVTARARVIRDPRTQALDPGDILVARHTDPGWIAVFSNASAIVVERGSLLSHSAIVARELGIPCVVGLKGATQWIKDGERVRVNGATGAVERLQ